jgi:hypothetical protein
MGSLCVYTGADDHQPGDNPGVYGDFCRIRLRGTCNGYINGIADGRGCSDWVGNVVAAVVIRGESASGQVGPGLMLWINRVSGTVLTVFGLLAMVSVFR